MRSVYLLHIVVIFLACSSQEKEPYQLPEDARLLLAGEGEKTWKLARRLNNGTRMNMGDCFLRYRQTYTQSDSTYTNNGEFRDCGESLFASWKFVKDPKDNTYIKVTSAQLPALMNQEQDFKLFKVLALEKDLLVVQFYHEQFSDKVTSITDVLVPEGTEVADRDFHW